MAQYFRPIIFSDKTPIVYEYRIGGKLEPRTLTERSWWNSPVLSTVCERIVNNPQRIVWIGSCPNYDNNITPPNGLSLDEVNYFKELAWGDNPELTEVFINGYGLGSVYIVNHSKKLCLDVDKYFNLSIKKKWCLHPLPLLTAVGNGFGGGDYKGINMFDVGSWANDLISIEDTVPKGYRIEPEYSFRIV